MRAQEWRLASYPESTTSLDNFALATRELPPVEHGEVLVKIGSFGFAPSLRFRMTKGGNGLPGMQIGEVFTASGLGVVVESRSTQLAAGDFVYGDVGWRDYGVFGPDVYLKRVGRQGEPLTNTQGVLGSESLPAGPFQLEDYIGILGGAGMAAFIGLLAIGRARAGESLLVTAAAGGIGNIVCQLGKIAGLTVHGTTRDVAKSEWLSAAVGVSRVHLQNQPQSVPKDLDILFENVGGESLAGLVPCLRNKSGRVVVCGVISEYEGGTATRVPLNPLVFKDIQMRGFFADHYLELWPSALDAMGRWLADGSLRRHYDIAEGLGNAPAAYLRLYRGNTNRGKLMLRVQEI